eukprot:404868-Rhodomonas_salina.1
MFLGSEPTVLGQSPAFSSQDRAFQKGFCESLCGAHLLFARGDDELGVFSPQLCQAQLLPTAETAGFSLDLYCKSSHSSCPQQQQQHDLG